MEIGGHGVAAGVAVTQDHAINIRGTASSCNATCVADKRFLGVHILIAECADNPPALVVHEVVSLAVGQRRETQVGVVLPHDAEAQTRDTGSLKADSLCHGSRHLLVKLCHLPVVPPSRFQYYTHRTRGI
mgnify:CR=1 FL=1